VVGLFKDDSHTLLRLTPVAMVTKICKFQHKNSYNSGCVRHITQIPAPIIGVFRVGIFEGVRRICLDRPCCHGNEKSLILTQNWL